jgi:hypothetical protein
MLSVLHILQSVNAILRYTHVLPSISIVDLFFMLPVSDNEKTSGVLFTFRGCPLLSEWGPPDINESFYIICV